MAPRGNGNQGKTLTGAILRRGPDAIIRECTDACSDVSSCKFVRIQCRYQPGSPFSIIYSAMSWREAPLQSCDCAYESGMSPGTKRENNVAWYKCR